MDDLGVVNGPSKDLLDSNVVNIEFRGISRHSIEGGLGEESTEEVLKTPLFAGNGGTDAHLEFSAVTDVLNGET